MCLRKAPKSGIINVDETRRKAQYSAERMVPMDDIIYESGLETERQWSEYLGLTTLGDLKDQYEKGNIKEIIQIC